MAARLVTPDSTLEKLTFCDEHEEAMTGSVVSSLHRLKDIDNRGESFLKSSTTEFWPLHCTPITNSDFVFWPPFFFHLPLRRWIFRIWRFGHQDTRSVSTPFQFI
jgi:hypothetical protein